MKKEEAKIIAKAIISLIQENDLPNYTMEARGGRGKTSEAKRRLRQKLTKILTSKTTEIKQYSTNQDNSWRVW